MATKYNYMADIQQHYGQGWEDVSTYETNSQYQNFEKSGSFITLPNGQKKRTFPNCSRSC